MPLAPFGESCFLFPNHLTSLSAIPGKLATAHCQNVSDDESLQRP